MTEIANGVFYCGIHDRDRKVFDQLVPLPQGTTYNSYLVSGTGKTALIDTMYEKFGGEYLDMIRKSGFRIDYIISNHAEPDHSGMIPRLLEEFPDAEVLCSAKCAENLANMLHVSPERIRTVADADKLELGGKTLRFISAPWVHWPDTMFTYLEEEKFLFSCDYFGAHYTDFELYADESPELANAAKRYYSEIMMPFRSFCRKYLVKVEELSPSMILPSHGPVYRNPSFIENLYDEWTSESVSRKILLPYVSMYDNSRIMCEYLAGGLRKRGVQVATADLMEADEGEIAMELIDAAGIVFGTSMVLTGPHPKTVYAAYLTNILRPKIKFYALVGSFGWAGNLSAPVDACFTLTKPEKLAPVIAKGKPTSSDFAKLDILVDEITSRLDSLAKAP